MALFQNVGKHCSHPGCNLKDFLPFTCDTCSKCFCLEHRTYEAHECTAGCRKQLGRVVLTCPLCQEDVAPKPNETPDAAMAAHVARGCVYGDAAFAVQKKRKEQKKKNTCRHKGCKAKLHDYDRFDCNTCGRGFCVAHRMRDVHKCAKFLRRKQSRVCRPVTSSAGAAAIARARAVY